MTAKRLTTKSRIEALANLTVDCYSRDRYGESGWRGAIRLLIGHDLSDVSIIAFLDSKHMRWAADRDGKRPYGKNNGETLRAYLREYPQYVSTEELKNLM